MNNRKKVYENLDEILVGENINTAINKMKRFTILLEYEMEPCDDCSDNNVFIYQVVFQHKNPNDHPNDYPRVYYDIRTNKVTGKWNGCIGN